MKDNIKRFLPAIDKLIAHYKKFNKDEKSRSYYCSTREDCPLCIEKRKKVGVGGACTLCPWVVFEKKDCGESIFELDTTAQRLARLRRWKRNIKRRIGDEKDI